MGDKSYEVIVIGGGINGLTAGAYLAKAGAKVLITERRWETGGAVMTDEVSGCRLNTHATYMMMMDVAPAYADLELEKWGCTYITPQPAVSILLKDGRSLSLYNDVEKSVESITRFSKKDAEIYRKVYLEFKEMCDECLVPQTYRPASPPLELLTMLNDKPLGRKILEISEKSPREIIEEGGFEPGGELVLAALPGHFDGEGEAEAVGHGVEDGAGGLGLVGPEGDHGGEPLRYPFRNGAAMVIL